MYIVVLFIHTFDFFMQTLIFRYAGDLYVNCRDSGVGELPINLRVSDC